MKKQEQRLEDAEVPSEHIQQEKDVEATMSC